MVSKLWTRLGVCLRGHVEESCNAVVHAVFLMPTSYLYPSSWSIPETSRSMSISPRFCQCSCGSGGGFPKKQPQPIDETLCSPEFRVAQESHTSPWTCISVYFVSETSNSCMNRQQLQHDDSDTPHPTPTSNLTQCEGPTLGGKATEMGRDICLPAIPLVRAPLILVWNKVLLHTIAR